VRATLGQISLNASQRSDQLDILVSGVQAQAEDRGNATRARLHDIIVLVAVFSALLLLATVVIGYFLATYLRDARERQRLALFPERNPSPVISLDAEGALSYANPGAMAMATALEVPSLTDLLPEDLGARLEELRHGQASSLHWEYWRGTRLIGISIHCLEDCDAFHVYLSDVTERKQAQAQLEYQAFHDVLTRLPNRRAFENRISDALADGQSGAVLLLAADRFQPVVDTLGHAFADRVVCAIAERLAPFASGEPATCHIHRFNGDLFAALLPKVTGADDATVFAARIAGEMAVPFLIEGRELFFSFSIGIARFPEDGANVGELLRHADTALQSVVRAGGRAALGYAGEMSARALERLETEHELRRAVERGELELHYQPQVEIASGRIIGVEALVRWRHPTKGLISPADFIPIAEESGAILDVGAWILVTACTQSRQWQQAGLPPPIMAVNISPRQFADPQLPKTVLHALNSTGLDAQWLELEITESAAMLDIDAVIATLHAFKTIGVSLSIDDFGTGYSSLSYLKRFPIDKLKVDQSFVRNMIEDPSDAAIARSVIMLGHSLGLTVIAEGVETQAHLRLLGDYGCEQFQGYLFSRPKPAVEVCAMLEEQHARHSKSA
jgi:diguanylate cyclase (GGDEF)-like protein